MLNSPYNDTYCGDQDEEADKDERDRVVGMHLCRAPRLWNCCSRYSLLRGVMTSDGISTRSLCWQDIRNGARDLHTTGPIDTDDKADENARDASAVRAKEQYVCS